MSYGALPQTMRLLGGVGAADEALGPQERWFLACGRLAGGSWTLDVYVRVLLGWRVRTACEALIEGGSPLV